MLKPTKLPAFDNPAFRAWFGKSVVVDGQGQPLVMFHGTKADFTVFNPGEDGACFTSNRKVVGRYAGRSGRVLAVYLRVLNPYVTDSEGWDGAADAPWIVKEEGEHDAYIVRNWAGPGHDMVLVFSAEQIKSATDNCGAFDPANPDIRA